MTYSTVNTWGHSFTKSDTNTVFCTTGESVPRPLPGAHSQTNPLQGPRGELHGRRTQLLQELSGGFDTGSQMEQRGGKRPKQHTEGTDQGLLPLYVAKGGHLKIKLTN